MSDFQLHPEAYTDIDDLWEYIAEDSLDSADRVREKIYDAIESLALFPNRGHRRADLTSRPLRFFGAATIGHNAISVTTILEA